MSRRVDLLIVGAGPAGLAAAITARACGLDVVVVDEQAGPGGQIWRDIEQVGATPRARLLGQAYGEGRGVVRAFRESGAEFLPETRMWNVDEDLRAYLAHRGRAWSIEAGALLLATGAQERPVPFPGSTLPGVMTVGAGQILLKSSGQVPADPAWIAGTGPLALLYAIQLLAAGGRIAGFLDTRPTGQTLAAGRHAARALLTGPRDIAKGAAWMAQLRRRVPVFGHAHGIVAEGGHTLERIRFRDKRGAEVTRAAKVLLVHEGVIPALHATQALGCRHEWDAAQQCFRPVLDDWGTTSVAGVHVAGDGAGIAGARAAGLRGELAALGVAMRLGRIGAEAAEQRAAPVRAALRRAIGVRPFLDALYPPRVEISDPPDAAIVCRCEEVRAGRVRALAAGGLTDPNQVKTATRAGMGPCHGRQCSAPIAGILARMGGSEVRDIAPGRVRPPIRPLTLAELASLDATEAPR
ncbi:NAD(P)/FAD-dependent oxidoreductase [Tropicimonas sp. IMCC34011]|uniref:FAD/NAD(P)-dependent oxidoreductase n=1 Tax=Tropicimonas sp. IMCC34011 TaxID=2248759 RepID=UPI000E2215F2|nr:NAD(P)/FAD-dependent oxidoreductase [Tropicimonas sp. IMCC34011]